jgi:hypothetical protein
MTSEQRDQIRDMTRRPVGSVWGYWPFVFPVVLVIIGIGVQVVLLWYFESRYGVFDILIRKGTKMDMLWDSQLVKQAVLTVALCITVTFALLATLAHRSHKQAVLLKAAARELDIVNGQPEGGANGSQPIRLETSSTPVTAGSRR